MAHGDEVGFMVSQINSKGLVRINPFRRYLRTNIIS
ncbi:hypothetical protein [Spiroplasma phoeniceum]